MAYLLCVLIVALAIRKARPSTFADFGLFRSNIKKQLLYGCFLGILLTIAAIPLGEFLWKNPSVEKAAVYFIQFLLVAFVEELLFRGYLLTAAQKFLTKDASILLISVLFGFMHLFSNVFQEFGLLSMVVSIISAIFFSLILCALRSEVPNVFGITSLTAAHFIFDFDGIFF